MSRHPFARKGNALVPVDDDGREAVNRLPHDKEVIVSIQVGRNLRHFRLFWALCRVVADNHPDIDDKENAKRNLLRATGRVHLWFDVVGNMHEELDSISFEKMPAEAFDEFFSAAVNVVHRWLGVAPQDIIDQVNDMLNPPRAAVTRECNPRQIDSPSIVTDSARQDEDALAQVGRGKVDAQ